MELKPEADAKVKVLHLEQKLYRWSKEGTYVLRKLYNLIHNPYVLSLAWYNLKRNPGSRTAGTDGVTATTIEKEIGVEDWLSGIQWKLRSKTFSPDLIRRAWIPKPFKSDWRPLGIPTLEDRLVQMALKLILEPIFEAQFKGCSLGFRPSRGPMHAIATLHRYMNPRNGYEWVIEADIRNCFGNIDHGLLLQRIKRLVPDKEILSLVRSFLKVGVLEQGQVQLPTSGSPQGGIISPLLANIYLDQLDEFYHNKYHALTDNQRRRLTKQRKPILRLIRYADDFVILVKGNEHDAKQALNDLRYFVRNTLKMELAEEKTGMHSLEEGFDFLGYNFRRGISLRTRKISTIIRPSKEAETRFRRKVKELTSSSTTYQTVDDLLRNLNRLIRGWGEYFRYGWVSRLFSKLDYYLFCQVGLWLKKKHKYQAKKKLRRHRTKFKRGTWSWIYHRYLQPDLTGRRIWTGEKVTLLSLSKTCPPRRLPVSTERVSTPYNKTSLSVQTLLTRFETGHKTVLTMEKLLQRQENRGKAG